MKTQLLATMEGSPSIVHPPPPTIPVTWSSLPRKRQLLILFFCRLADFLQVMSLQSYAFYQLKSFSLSLPDSTISWQAGIIHAAFPATQFITAVIWGHLADRDWMGRKNALLIGLVGTGISCVGLGFSGSFGEAVGWRLVGGAVNGTVGIM
jgi:MFS family permease